MGEIETIKFLYFCGCVVIVLICFGIMFIEVENKGEFIKKKKKRRINKKKDIKVGNLIIYMVVKEYLFKVNIIDI